MKIKDAVVIEFSLLKDIVSALNSEGLEAWSEVLIQDYKPLEPIIEDAYNSGMNELNSNIHGLSNYLNDTVI
jgi:hypothetical protein